MDSKVCVVCGTTFTRRPTERPATFAGRKRCGFYSNRMDNSPENIAFLCRKHHLAAHKLSDGKVGGGARPRIAALMHDRATERWQRAVVLRARGYTNAEIASELFVHRDSVQRWFDKYGESIR